MRSFVVPLLCTSMLFAATGCTPDIAVDAAQEKAKLAVPKDFANVPPQEGQAGAMPATQDWQLFFADPQLQALIGEALGSNQELRIVEQEIAISRNEIMARRGEYLPKVGVGAGYEIERVGQYTSQGQSDEALELGKVLRNREVGAYASWEVDIWKKLRNAKESAVKHYLASVEGRKFMQNHMIAEIADTYYELVALDAKLAIVTQYVDTLKDAQQVVEYQKEAAKATSLAVNRFAAEVQKNQSLEYTITQQITETENRLNALVGRFPQPVPRSKPQDFLRAQLPAVKAGLPADLLQQRPDIQQAELDMQASALDVKVAKARFYPSLSLDAGAGFQGFNSHYFLNAPESVFYNVAANLTAPVLNRTAIEADYLSANSKQLQAVYHYQQTVINAYVEVVNQLNAIHNIEKTYASQQAEVNTLHQAVGTADVLFNAARIDYLEALLTKRDALEAQMELMEVKQKQLSAYLNLYRALGGGWHSAGDHAERAENHP